jgi:hypothetical protein
MATAVEARIVELRRANPGWGRAPSFATRARGVDPFSGLLGRTARSGSATWLASTGPIPHDSRDVWQRGAEPAAALEQRVNDV